MIKQELINKRTDSQAELLKWEDIASELTQDKDLSVRQLRDIPF
jgi:hypothetical protein